MAGLLMGGLIMGAIPFLVLPILRKDDGSYSLSDILAALYFWLVAAACLVMSAVWAYSLMP